MTGQSNDEGVFFTGTLDPEGTYQIYALGRGGEFNTINVQPVAEQTLEIPLYIMPGNDSGQSVPADNEYSYQSVSGLEALTEGSVSPSLKDLYISSKGEGYATETGMRAYTDAQRQMIEAKGERLEQANDLLEQGYSQRDVAQQVGVSEATIEGYIATRDELVGKMQND